MNEYDPFMENIAVVADEKWRDQMLMYLGLDFEGLPCRFSLQAWKRRHVSGSRDSSGKGWR